MSFASTLKCSLILSLDYEAVGFRSTCLVQSMNVTRRAESISSASVSGISQVKGVMIESQTIHYMPKFDEFFGQRLEVMIIVSSHMKVIDKEDLRNYPNLELLRLWYNDLEWLPEDLFEFTPKLRSIDFDGNQLKHIGANILQPLKQLKVVGFNGAGCVNYQADIKEKIELLKGKLLEGCQCSSQLETSTKVRELEMQVESRDAELVRLNDATRKADSLARQNAELKRDLDMSYQHLIAELEKSIELSKEILELRRKLSSCNRNLDSSTRFLAPFVGQLSSQSTDKTLIDVTCSNASATGTCEIVNFVTTKPETEIVTMSNQTDNESRIVRVIIRQQSALFLPANLASAFAEVQFMEVSESGLFFIERETFHGLENLESLNLTRNKLTTVERETFASLNKLKLLDLSFNNIEYIDADAFVGIGDIEIIKLNDNKLGVLHAHSIDSLRLLKIFDLRNNICVNLSYPEAALSVIQTEVDQNCHTPIQFTCELKNDDESCQAKNLRVDFPKSRIQKVFGLSQILKVYKLTIKEETVKFLPLQMAKTFPILRSISIVKSSLTSLSRDDFVGLGDLKQVEIRGNNLTSIDADSFNSVPQLKYLDLSENHIQSLPPRIFQQLTAMKELFLSSNEIKVLNADIFPKQHAIQTFKIDSNEIELVEMKCLEILKQMKNIDLSGNICVDVNYVKKDEDSLREFQTFYEIVEFQCGLDFEENPEKTW